jgi:predicted transcriptional regulator
MVNNQEATMTNTDPLQIIRQAIADPGAYVHRRWEQAETVPAWGARAVLLALAQAGYNITRADTVLTVELPPLAPGRDPAPPLNPEWS